MAALVVSVLDSLETERGQELGLFLKWDWKRVDCIPFQLKDLL